MTEWRNALIGVLQTTREKNQVARAQAAVDQHQADLAKDVIGAWADRPFTRAKDRVLDMLRGSDERRRAADVRALLEANDRHVDERIEDALKRYDKVVDFGGTLDLTGAAQAIRAQMGWPTTGSVSGLLGGSSEICRALESIEASGGQLPISEAIKILAVLNPKGIEAAYLEWRRVQGRPLL